MPRKQAALLLPQTLLPGDTFSNLGIYIHKLVGQRLIGDVIRMQVYSTRPCWFVRDHYEKGR